jgi:hypothetical protein
MGQDWRKVVADAIRDPSHRRIAAGVVAGLGAAIAIGGRRSPAP